MEILTFFRWDDRPSLSCKFDDHPNKSETPKGITSRYKVKKTSIKQKPDTSVIEFGSRVLKLCLVALVIL